MRQVLFLALIALLAIIGSAAPIFEDTDDQEVFTFVDNEHLSQPDHGRIIYHQAGLAVPSI